MSNIRLLDEIKIKDRVLTGIIDYVTPMYVTFYDVTMNDDPFIVKVILTWRMYYSHMRFSVFKELYFQSLDIQPPNLINRKKISCWGDHVHVTVNKPNKTSRRVTKRSKILQS